MADEIHKNVVRRMRPLLGTFVEVATVATDSAETCIEAAFAAMANVHECLSFHSPHSELTRLNESHGTPVRLSPLSRRVLALARGLQIASDGLFNCTVGAALVRSGDLPDHGGRPALDHGVAADIVLERTTVRLARPVRVTLDGIAKGFAIDLAVAAMRRHGACAGWVNAGGDLKAFGEIALPVACPDARGKLRSLGGLRNAALATSRVRDIENSSFAGRIVSAHGAAYCGQWSVLARSAWRADGLTKVAALAPASKREALLERLGGRLLSETLEAR
jgi:FAD:protein FMN transferase